MISSRHKGKWPFYWRDRRVLFVCVQSRKETIDHALSCIARVLDVLLGAGAAAPNKLHTGMSLVILGVRLSMSAGGFQFCPEERKVHCLVTM